MELTDYQRDILIRTALGEAAGEGKEGMAAVLHVILNRANSGQFPSDPADVALQNKQFSTWNKGAGGNNPRKWKESSASYKTAAAALDSVLSAKSDPTGGALYYHAKGVTPYWADDVNKNGVIKIGAHRFYPSHPVPKSNIPDVASATDFGPGIPTPMLNRKPVVVSDNRRAPTAAQTAAEQRLARPDYRSMGFVPLPAPAPLRASSGPQSGVGTSTLAPPTRVKTYQIDANGQPIITKAAMPPRPVIPQSQIERSTPHNETRVQWEARTAIPKPGGVRLTPETPSVPRPLEPTPLGASIGAMLPSLPIIGPLSVGLGTAANLTNPTQGATTTKPLPKPVPPQSAIERGTPYAAVKAPVPQSMIERGTPYARPAPAATLPRLPMMPTPAMSAARLPTVPVPVRAAPITPARTPLTQTRTVNPITQIVPAAQSRMGQGLFGGLFNMLTAGNVPQANLVQRTQSAQPSGSPSNLQHNPNWGPAPGVHPHLNQFGMFD